MKAFIHACATTSVLSSVNNGILENLSNENNRVLLKPDYSSTIPVSLIRRMSRIIEIGVGTALRAKGEYDVQGIIVGTGIGCIDNALTFLKGCMGMEDGLKSPGTFVQSTHNTIAGQIGLIIKSNAYNITHTHRGLSFENALIDAMLLSNEEGINVLIGGVDEKVELLEILKENVYPDSNCWLGEGASFFILNQKDENALAIISSCEVAFNSKVLIQNSVHQFLNRNKLKKPDLILYGNSFFNKSSVYSEINGVRVFNYSDICGVYYANSSFGMQLAIEILFSPSLAEKKGLHANNILILNNFNDTDISMIYLSSIAPKSSL